MREYKTPEEKRARLNERRQKIKNAGGFEYLQLLERERLAKRQQRRKRGRKPYDKKRSIPIKTWLCANARFRARKAGLEATITASDLDWPSHCPVLGVELLYPARSGEGGDWKRPDRPSLDRWDNTKGYVPGNVFVISLRANLLKSNATVEELEAIARYARVGL